MHTTHFVAVNYLGAGMIGPLLESLWTQTSGDWHATIVDNSYDPAETQRLHTATTGQQASQQIDVQTAPWNLGYLGAVRWWQARDPCAGATEWTVICNTDIQLAPNFVAELAATDRGQMVTAPNILTLPGERPQNPYMTERPSVGTMRLRANMLRWHPVAQLYRRAATIAARRRPKMGGPARLIYAAHGSVLPIHRRFFDAGGTLDHGPFLFGEEITIAERVRHLGGTIGYQPSVMATHSQHQATGTQRNRSVSALQAVAAANCYRLIRAG